MLGSFRWVWAGLLLLVVGLAGCGKDPFGPPEREVSTENEEPEEKSKTLFFISPRTANQEIVEIAQQVQAEANLRHTISRIMEPPADDPALDQVELIKMALKDDASGLILIPGESPALGKVLAEAEARGVPVALIGRSVPAPEGSKPFTVIDFAPLTEFASKIVTTTIDDLTKAGRPIDGTVLLLKDQVTDRTSADRLASLKAALASASLTKVVELSISGDKKDQAIAQIKEALKATPDTVMILADDAETLLAAAKVAEARADQPMIGIGGFVNFTPLKPENPIPWEFVSCYCQGGYERMGKLATETILSRLSGQAVPDRVLLAPFFRRLNPEERKSRVPHVVTDPRKNPPQPRESKP